MKYKFFPNKYTDLISYETQVLGSYFFNFKTYYKVNFNYIKFNLKIKNQKTTCLKGKIELALRNIKMFHQIMERNLFLYVGLGIELTVR